MSAPLPGEAIEALAPFVARHDLERLRVVTERPWCWVPLALRASATTWGHYVMFRRGSYQAGTARGLALIAHEAAHVTQFRELGAPRFAVRYLAGQLRCGFRHDRHRMERGPIALQRMVRAEIGGDTAARDSQPD